MTISRDRLEQIRTVLAVAVTDGTDGVGHAKAPAQLDGTSVLVVPRAASTEHMGSDDPTDMTVDLVAMVPLGHENWQDELDSFIAGDRSIFAALAAARRDLNDAGIAAHADGWDDYGQKEWAGSTYWSVRVPVELMI